MSYSSHEVKLLRISDFWNHNMPVPKNVLSAAETMRRDRVAHDTFMDRLAKEQMYADLFDELEWREKNRVFQLECTNCHSKWEASLRTGCLTCFSESKFVSCLEVSRGRNSNKVD